jgi:hypothetical protein
MSPENHPHIMRSRALLAVRIPLHNHAFRACSAPSEIGTTASGWALDNERTTDC